MIEIEFDPVVPGLADPGGCGSAVARFQCRELHGVTWAQGKIRWRVRLQGGTRHPLHPGSLGKTEGSLGPELEAGIRALLQAQQAGFESRCKLPGAKRECRRTVAEGVDPVMPILRGEAVMQSQQGIGAYAGHSL